MDLARGAQAHARALQRALQTQTQPHVSLTLFDSEGSTLNADMTLGVRAGRLRRMGLDPVVPIRLRSVLRDLRPTGAVAHGGESLKYTAWVLPRQIPLIYHRIGTSSPKLENPFRRALYRAAVQRADAVVAVSEDALTDLQRLLHRPPRRSLVIPNARDEREYRPRDGEPRSGPPRLIFVGHLTAIKRPALFLEIVEDLRRKGLVFEAGMVGDGPLRKSLEVRSAELGVEFLGRRNDVPRLLSESDILVFPSMGENEGLPGVLIEAGLSGLATVSTDVSGVGSAIVDGETGFVVGIDDREAMVAAIRRLICEPELRARMGQAARAHCVANFSIESTAAEWRQLIADLVSQTQVISEH